MKLSYLFSNGLQQQDDRMNYIMWLSRREDGATTLYAPPICIDNQFYPLVALRMQKLRVVIALGHDALLITDVIEGIQRLLGPLCRHSRNARFETNRGQQSGP
jgi:hypothetical protein